MSASLLRRGLELLGAPEGPETAPGPAQASGASGKRAKRRAKAAQAQQQLRNSAKGKVPKSALVEYQKRHGRSHLRENLKLLSQLRSPVSEAITQQIVQQNQGRKACDRPVDKTKKKKAEGTVFTEEDFQKFQQEYFGS
ncbi:active regulator of SIRT1 [Suncus etruscus]|uniref:active regulator of SIRT1 n=1 Tax=Suncus etruscus TaxID=109475 RepID=UPI0021108AEC|nr:active regulator of SIRT1 [Suncus etruscus]